MNVLITGISGGIGQALGRTFKQAGYTVFGLDVRPAESSVCDCFFEIDLAHFVGEEAYRNGHSMQLLSGIPTLDVLIHNAAVQLLDPTEDIRLADWQRTLAVNLTAPMLLTQLLLEKLTTRKGLVLMIGSIHQKLTKPAFVTYATSKSALVGFTQALAVDLAGKVRVNCISPASTETEMLLDGFKGNEQVLDTLRKIHPVGRIGTPSDVAELALFLASDRAGFIHGANIALDGGIGSVLKDI